MDVKTNKDMKIIVTAILKNEHVNYDNWLYEKHLEFLAAHSNVIVTALQKESTKNSPN